MANNFDLQIKWLNGSQVEIQAGEGASLTGDEKVLIMQNDTPKETTTQAIADLGGGGGSSYLVYTALLTQSGTNDPVATVLGTNTIGNIVWTRTGVGTYNGTLAGVFTESKTTIQVTGGIIQNDGWGIEAYPNTINTVSFDSYDLGGNSAEADRIDMFCEIRVYP